MTTITHKSPTQQDDRYSIFNKDDETSGQMPIGFARKTREGFDFWRMADSGNTKIPHTARFRTMKELKEEIALALEVRLSEKEIWEKLSDLACQLSPENLTCDGELSRNMVKLRKASIMKQWAVLEASLGFKVTEDQVWQREIQRTA